LKSPDIADQAIHRQQQGSAQGHDPNLVGQALDQGAIPLLADDPTQPQPSWDHHRHRHPDYATHYFDFDFIRLHLKQIELAMADDMLVHRLTMLSSPPPPLLDRPLVKPKSHHNGLDRTTISQQGQHQDHRLRRCFQTVEDTAFAHTKGLGTHRTHTSLFFETMDTNIATPTLSFCRTLKVRAKYLFEVHWTLLLVVVTQKCAPEPRFVQIYPVITL
jgi:hypothetical protein